MQLKEALAKAGQILDQERAAPTVSYAFDDKAAAAKYTGQYAGSIQIFAAMTGDTRLASIRLGRPRQVQEDPQVWNFKSVNCNLLCALYAQIATDLRPAFVKGILERMAEGGCAVSQGNYFCKCWRSFVSDLPLIAEFCVRNGSTEAFLGVLPKIKPSPGKAVLLQYLEDMVALNFTVFSDAEYVQLELRASGLRDAYNQKFYQSREAESRGERRAKQYWEGTMVPSIFLWQELRDGAVNLMEESRKARYFYLKGSLLEGLNIEINQDREAVQSYLRQLGFTETLAKSLDEAERLYREGGSAFDMKASMGHLRSFLEGLHNSAFPLLLSKYGGTTPPKWGAGLTYLRENCVLSKAEEQFAASLYTISSDQAVHPLMAEREYARLIRNVVIEYALLILSKLERLGLKAS